VTTTEHGRHTEAAPPGERRGGRGRIAVAVGLIGELLVTAGLVLGLFVVYSLWWTNVIAGRQATKDGNTVRRDWAAAAVSDQPGRLDTKDGIGFLHVPAMGKDFEVLVKKGTSTDVLNQGVAGYYTGPVKSAMPWDKSGNFTLAAHRDGHGAKFHNIDRLKAGDSVVFESRTTWYIYKVYDVLPQTSKFNTNVIDQVPKESGKNQSGRYITLTTCTPVYTSLYRYIVWGELVRTQKVDAARTPAPEVR
jgi:LPXTG-site transpeptidase (sortase) family protein